MLLEPAEVDDDIPKITPRFMPAASASFCALARASEIKSDCEHGCDCCNCCDACVPCRRNERLKVDFFWIKLCWMAVRLAVVSLIRARGAVSVKFHCSWFGVGRSGGNGAGFPMEVKLIPEEAETPVKLAAVIPALCTTDTTSVKAASAPDPTVTLKTASSGCKVWMREAVTVTEFESSWAKARVEKTRNDRTRHFMPEVYPQ